MAIPVEARYVPKSISYERRDGGVRIRVKATSPGNLLRAAALIIGAFIVPPFFLFMSFGTAAIVFLAMIGGGLYLLFGASPPMLISRDGVEVSGLLYRAQDAAFFTDSADDAAIPSYFSAVKLNQLGLAYGIYSMRMPYILPVEEVAKVAQFLTQILKEQTEQLNVERERKIQQAEIF
jgi:hypothetical protein